MFYQKVPSYLSQTLDRIDTEKALRDDYAKIPSFFIRITIISNRYTASGSAWTRRKLRTP